MAEYFNFSINVIINLQSFSLEYNQKKKTQKCNLIFKNPIIPFD